MFAHQVIEDLKKQENGIFKDYSYWIKFSRNLIEKAHCFHAGEAFDIHGPVKSMDGNGFLFTQHGNFIKLPYDIMWLDAKTTKGEQSGEAKALVSREGILAAKIVPGSDRFIACFILSFFEVKKLWTLIPMLYFISIGKCFTPEDRKELQDCTGMDFGELNETSNMKVVFLSKQYQPISDEQFKIEHESCAINLQMLNDFLLLLNCKNITAEINSPDLALNKARRKRGKQELFSYKTLKISLPSDKTNLHENNQQAEEHNRIHFCRGHFKEYTADKPLFGKITGLWWWQPHVRGQNKDGIVMKDYEVMAQ